MDNWTVWLISAVYIVCLALVDGLFNRLVFREKRALPYESEYKQIIYSLWEWKAIGVIFLIFLPIVLPCWISYLIGGMQVVYMYLIVLLVVPWDVLFGKIVFNRWLADTPSIALPYVGWVSVSLRWVTIIRLGLFVVLLFAMNVYSFE